jgi:hypothetical protein
MASIEEEGAKTITCKLPKAMLPVVVGDDGKIVADIARYQHFAQRYCRTSSRSAKSSMDGKSERS